MNRQELEAYLSDFQQDAEVRVFDAGTRQYRPLVNDDLGVLLRAENPAPRARIGTLPAGSKFRVGEVVYTVMPSSDKSIIVVQDALGNRTHWSTAGGLPRNAELVKE